VHVDLSIMGFRTEDKNLPTIKEVYLKIRLTRILVHEVKPANIWLKTTNSQALLASLVNVESAFTSSLEKKLGFLTSNQGRIQFSLFNYRNIITIDFDTNTIKLPKDGDIKASFIGSLKVK